MGKDTGVNGEAFTDNDLDAWAAQAESPEGYSGGHIGPAQTGGPVGIGAQVRAFTFRMDADRRAKFNRVAAERSASEDWIEGNEGGR